MSKFHTSVMLAEVIDALDIKKGSWYVDCNLGGGGHTQKILEMGGKVLGIDLDTDAILEVTKNLHQYLENGDLVSYQGNFENLKNIVSELKIQNITGVLFDLGVSSHQLEQSDRGFSFNSDATLDMRMDQNLGVKAADLINGLHEKELADLFLKYGEESWSKLIAKRIIEKRKEKKIETTLQLVDIIKSVKKQKLGNIHPATQVFQALRIAVNDELNSLESALPQALDLLEVGGTIAVISFHSLEDRIVKNQFKEWEEKKLIKLITDKPLVPTQVEIDLNPRARSAKLRVCQKL